MPSISYQSGAEAAAAAMGRGRASRFDEQHGLVHDSENAGSEATS